MYVRAIADTSETQMYFTQALHRNLAINPDRPMTICGDRTLSVYQFVDRVARLAGALQQLGVRPGDRVAMLALNSDDYMAYCFAVPWANAVLNPCNIRWSAKENAYALNDSETSVLLVDDAFAAMAKAMVPDLRSIRHIIYVGVGEAPAGMLNLETLISQSTPIEDARRGGDALLGIFYTGGTTGFPKGVMLSHTAFWASQMSLANEGVVPRGSMLMRAAPMFHLADMAMGFAGVLQNATHVIIPMFHPVSLMAAIQQHRVATMLLVPTMIQMLIGHPEVRNYDLSSWTVLGYGASPIQEQVLLDLQTLLPDLNLYQAYGQTEVGPGVSILGPDQHRKEAAERGMLRSCGRPIMCVEVRIVDSEGKELPVGEVGEIAVRGPNLMQGYWNKPDQTRVALPGDGWLRTGDGARMDANGYLFIVDRVKDMIVTGGENVFSVEVENALASHPDVAMCAVIGIPDSQWGEAVHAVVVAKPGTAPTAPSLIAHCKTLIAGYKCPKSVELRDALPISGAGKILKSDLRAPYWAGKTRQVA